jgi:hypothetical protein
MSTQTPLSFCTACKQTISGLKTVNSNAFRLSFLALFEIFWVYTSATSICKQTVTALCEHTEILPTLVHSGVVGT